MDNKKEDSREVSERITAIIYSNPELRELYKTDKNQAILEAKMIMFENAESESMPLTSENNSPRR